MVQRSGPDQGRVLQGHLGVTYILSEYVVEHFIRKAKQHETEPENCVSCTSRGVKKSGQVLTCQVPSPSTGISIPLLSLTVGATDMLKQLGRTQSTTSEWLTDWLTGQADPTGLLRMNQFHVRAGRFPNASEHVIDGLPSINAMWHRFNRMIQSWHFLFCSVHLATDDRRTKKQIFLFFHGFVTRTCNVKM